MNETTRSGLKTYLKSDYLLNNYFKDLFEIRLKRSGQEKLQFELQKLSSVNADILSACSVTAEDNCSAWGLGMVGTRSGWLQGDGCR